MATAARNGKNHMFLKVTITLANTAQNLGEMVLSELQDLAPGDEWTAEEAELFSNGVAWFAIYDNPEGTGLHIANTKAKAENSLGMDILAAYKVTPFMTGNNYDLFSYWLKASADDYQFQFECFLL